MRTDYQTQAGPQPVFRALADPTRRQILLHLARENLSIGDIADRFEITRAAIKKHLVILEEGDLIASHPDGRERINSLKPAGLKSAFEWLGFFDRYWDDKLARLQTAVDKSEKVEKS
jgi:DNA-binding transcriptional ArsR family regulator